MACNFGGEAAAALTADVNAGDEVKITWNRWPDDHKVGLVALSPAWLLTYIRTGPDHGLDGKLVRLFNLKQE